MSVPLAPTTARGRWRLFAGLVAAAAGGVVLWLAVDLFPYHSLNHDEGVYLQQAAMLLEGRLWLTPGSEPLREAVHPWFFVESDRGLYPKYAPVPAAVFAAGELLGGYRLALGAVAAANVALVYAVATAAFDRPTGVLAAVATAAAPLFLFTSSTFLPYAPTATLNLLFAVAYVRSVRRSSRRYAAAAGLAVGLAFFARPYTAVLFVAPFVVHALWELRRGDPEAIGRNATTAAVGLMLVGVTLGYNALMTGSPLVFPYEAFAPRDGIGFGRRRILGHSVVYTPELAVTATASALWTLATDWFVAGPAGTALAVAGAAVAAVRMRRRRFEAPMGDRCLQVVLLGVGASVVVGNVYFWGTYNLLGDPAVAGDGLVSLFGPFYHFDLLVVLSAFAAHAAVAGLRWLRARSTVALLVVLAVTLPAVGAAEAGALGGPADRHAAHTEKLAAADEPLRTTDLGNGLVLVPPEYGEWRNHPFQWLRNDPGLDGPTVYALSRGPAADFAVLSAYPDRRYYRYRYNGEWTPDPTDSVAPVLRRVSLREGPVAARTTVAIPDTVTRVSVAVSVDGAVRRYDHRGELPEELAVDWAVTGDGAAATGPTLAARDSGGPVPIEEAGTVALAVTLTEPGGATLTYREELAVRPTDDGVVVLWPPAGAVCPLVTDCGLEGTYVPDSPETRPDGTAMNTTLEGRP